MLKTLKYSVIALFLAVGVAYGQTLSDQVLLLLSRANTWTAAQTFDDVTITGTCTGCGGAGGGTVTSVASTVDTELDAIVSLTGSPITGSGTLAFTLDSQNANIVLAGPSSGGATDPTFRALVDDDIPDNITIAGTNNVTWASVNKTGSDSADLATFDVDDVTAGTLALANLTDDDVTANLPLVSGGAGGNPVYEALDLTSSTVVSGQLVAASFPALTGDVESAGGTLTTDLSNTGVSAATYGSATAVGQFTVDEDGRITSASNVTIGTAALLSTTYCSDCSADGPTRGSIIYVPVGGTWDELVLGAAGTAIISDGTDLAWSADGTGLNIDVDNATAGVLAVARGGTAKALTMAVGQVVYTDANSFEVLAAGTLGECLVSQGASAPIWDTCATTGSHTILDGSSHTDTAADTVSRGSLIIGNSSPAWDELVIGASGTMLRSDGTDVSWSTDGTGLTTLNASSLSTGTIPAGRLGTIGVGNGGTGIITYNVGDLITASAATTLTTVSDVAVGQILSSGGVGVVPAWSNVLSLTGAGPHGIGTAPIGTTRLTMDGSFTSDGSGTIVMGLNIIGALTGAAGDTTHLTGVRIDTDITTQGSSETIADVAQLRLHEPNITVGSGDTVTDASTLIIVDAPTEGTNNYALLVDSGDVRIDGDVMINEGVLAFSSTAPTISSGFGTTPSVSAENGTIAFRVNVGTGGTATAGVIGLPTATTGWLCWTDNITAQAANDADQRTVQTATSTTSATIENQTVSTGAAVAWSASDVLMVSCFAY